MILSPEKKDSICLVNGFANPELGLDIAQSMGVSLDPIEQKRFPNGERYVRFLNSIRGRHVFVVQTHCGGPEGSINDAMTEQALLVLAASNSSASEVTAVVPFLGYSRQDRKSKGREPGSVRFALDQLALAGANRIVAVDMHSPQTQLVFRGQFDHLTAQPELRAAVKDEVRAFSRDECLIVAPDAGAASLAYAHQKKTGYDFLLLTKTRSNEDSGSISRDQYVPEADGRVCMIFDDMIDTAGTIVSAVEALKNSGAKAVFTAATHGIFSEPALQRLKDAPIDRILVTDTFPHVYAKEVLGDKLRVVSMAPIIGQALLHIVTKTSISEIFDDQNHR